MPALAGGGGRFERVVAQYAPVALRAVDRSVARSRTRKPESIRVVVTQGATSGEVRADELGIQPIDLVVELGADSTRLPPRLRARIERAVRARDGLAADAVIAIDGPLARRWAATRTLFELSPLVLALFSVLRSRAASAGDLAVGTTAPAWDLGELCNR